MYKRLIAWLVPEWMRPDDPAIRLILGRSAKTSWLQWAFYIFSAALLITTVILGARYIPFIPSEVSRTEILLNRLFIMVFLGQHLITLNIFSSALHVINEQRRRRTWDMVRVTAGGSYQAIRAAWVATLFYRLSGWIGVFVYAPRLLMCGVLFFELLGFRGEYIDQIIGGASPPIPQFLGIPLLALILVGTLLLPLTAIGVGVAVGLLSSTFSRSHIILTLTQTVLTIGTIVLGMFGSIVAFYTNSSIAVNQGVDFWYTLTTTTVGDWGFGLLHAARLERLFLDVPYMGYLGVALMGIIALHLVIIEGILRWAARRAQRVE